MKIKNHHTAVMCRTLSKTIWTNPISQNFKEDMDDEKIQFQFAYTTNLNGKDFDIEAVQKIVLLILKDYFCLVNDNNKRHDIDIIEFEIEADGNYSFRFSTTLETIDSSELAFIINFKDNKLQISQIDISNVSLNESENFPK